MIIYFRLGSLCSYSLWRCYGLKATYFLLQVETSIYHIDPSHDLGLEICIDGFKCCDFKFPRLETFCTMAKLSATKFSISETLIFEPNNSNGK